MTTQKHIDTYEDIIPSNSYEGLLLHILRNGVLKPTRAILPSTGERVRALSVFGHQIRFNLADGFPAVTTKKLAFGNVVTELLWFLSGSTNVAGLHAYNNHIWDAWADSKGDLGPVYGKQWRSWAGFGLDGQRVVIDQIANVVRDIKSTRDVPEASCGRRLLVTAWNPPDIQAMALPPCHCLFQFSVTKSRLSCQLYQRSADAFLGIPFNIASYALLTHMIAQVCGLEVGEFIHTFGDLHIYENHLEQVKEQVRRAPFAPPKLWLNSRATLDEFCPADVALLDYQHHPALKGEVAV